MGFTSFGLSEKLLKGVTAAGYTTPTEIQERAIPIVLDGNDLIGCAQTGTGKTAAFVLPTIERLLALRGRRGIKALVLTPTRELALQIEESAKSYSRFLQFSTLAVYGGVGMEPQVRTLRRGVDMVIATPGRLLDHVARRSIDLSNIDILILDEADRMFDMGFINDVRKIISNLPTDRQTLLFSATMSEKVLELASSILQDPEHIEVGERRNPAESVTQHFYPIPKEMKLPLLIHILQNEEMESILVFSRTKHGADRIAARLEHHGIKAVAIHSNRTQSQRVRALDGFKRGQYRVLVATDIAARGIDIDGISHVINYDTPSSPEDYIHRIGRTGRASSTGDAVTFVAQDEEQNLRKMERFIGRRLPRKQYPGFAHTPSNAGNQPAVERGRSNEGSSERKSTGRSANSRAGSDSRRRSGRR